MTEDEMVGWHHRLDGLEFEQAPGDGEGPGKPGMLQSQRVVHNLETEQQRPSKYTWKTQWVEGT